MIKNLHDGVNSLHEIISVHKNQVVSKALVDSDNTDIRLFSLYKGEVITNEIYPMDTMIVCLEGKMEVVIEGKPHTLSQNDMIRIEVGRDSSLKSLDDSIILQIMVKD